MFARRFVSLVALAGLFVFIGTAAAGAAPATKDKRPGLTPPASKAAAVKADAYVQGQVIVKFKAGVSATARSAAAGRASAHVQRVIPRCWAKDGSTLVVVRSATQTTAKLVKLLAADPSVAYAEPDYIVHTDATPNDTRWNELWGMTRISAPSAWNVSTGSSTVVIADIDTGVDYTHTDLAANMWHNPLEWGGTAGVDDDGNGYIDDLYGYDAANSDSNPMDDHGHGSHTSGTAAAVGNNSAGVAGVCWTARIMALKFLDSGGSGSTSDAITCINYVVNEKTNHGVNVVAMNNSWGGGGYEQSLKDAITAAGTAGIVFVASAGNGGDDGVGDDNDATPSYPASYTCSNIIAVAATNSFDTLAGFSNYGATSVDLAAPGVGTLSTVPTSIVASGYASMGGTSMAAPHVTGAVALCAAAFPAESMALRMNRVLTNTDAVSALSGKCITGGRLNVAKAVGVAPSDQDIPGVPLPVSPISDSLTQSSDMNDVYSVFLKAGQTLNASISGAAGTNFNLYLFAPSAANVSNKSLAVASATGTTYPDAFSYVAATTGTYYLNTYATSGSGSYTLTWAITDDDDIPGVAAPSSPFGGTLDAATDVDDVYALNLSFGQTITASISGPGGSDFRLLLYAPGSTSIWDDYYLIGATSGSYPRTFTYQVMESGTFYLDAWAYSGSGSYTVTYAVTPAGADDEVPGVPITASPVTGSIARGTDWADVYRFDAAAGQSIQMSITGPAGTDFDLYLYPPGTTSYWTGTTVSGATGTGYPDSFTYAAAAAGTYYLVVWPYSGSGAYTLTHNIPVDVTAPTTTLLGHTATGWVNHDVTFTLQATDDIIGVARIEYMLGAGAWTTYGAPVTVSAEGETLVGYRAVDNAGNTEAAKSATVRIDKTGPVTTASNKVSVKKNKKATFRFKVADRTATAKVTIKIYKGKKLKKSLAVGSKSCGSAQSYSWKKCALAKGKYTWKVYATDEAGNTQVKIGAKTLVVK